MSSNPQNKTIVDNIDTINVEQTLNRTEDFLKKNRQIIAYVALGMLALVAVWIFFATYFLPNREKEAQSQLFAAERYFEMDSLDKAIKGDGNNLGFEQIRDDYSWTKSANLCNYYLGVSYLKKGQFENAIDALNKFDSKDQIVAPIAKGALGDAYLELDKTENAFVAYRDAANTSANNFTTPYFLLKAGQVAEKLSKNQEALALYQRISDDYKTSMEFFEIGKYIARAEAKIK